MTDHRANGRTSLYDRAVRDLRALILSGQIDPDLHLSETAASELIGMSRTPTREAMAHLVEEGLLERTESGRCSVRQFSHADVVDAIEFRGVLEGTVLRLAAERGADPASVSQCGTLISQMDVALAPGVDDLNFAQYGHLNEQFHTALACLAGSPTLERELRRAQRMPLAAPNAFLQTQENVPDVRRSLYRAQDQHRAMLDAVVSGEGTRAEAMAREHARLARENLDYVMFRDRKLAARIPGMSLVSRPDDSAS